MGRDLVYPQGIGPDLHSGCGQVQTIRMLLRSASLPPAAGHKNVRSAASAVTSL